MKPKRESKDYSKIYKVKNFTEILRKNFQKNYNFGRCGTIDDSMIKFKGRSSIKQYLPLKPIKRGYKVWCLCDPITGYLFNYQIYGNRKDEHGKLSIGMMSTREISTGKLSTKKKEKDNE